MCCSLLWFMHKLKGCAQQKPIPATSMHTSAAVKDSQFPMRLHLVGPVGMLQVMLVCIILWTVILNGWGSEITALQYEGAPASWWGHTERMPHLSHLAACTCSHKHNHHPVSLSPRRVGCCEDAPRLLPHPPQAMKCVAQACLAMALLPLLCVCVQVAARLAAAGHNRSLWPPAARQEVADVEQQLELMQVRHQHGRTRHSTAWHGVAWHGTALLEA